MVKRILSSAILVSAILSTSSAFAADLPMNAPTYAPAPQHPLWTGFYAGVNVGPERMLRCRSIGRRVHRQVGSESARRGKNG